jgi:hypothetical protein
MSFTLSREFITDALAESVIDPKLRALYELCFMHRHHLRDEIVVDKLHLIGRLYGNAAAWPDNGFSAEAAAHSLSRSPVDRWFGALSTAERLDPSLLLELHKRLMDVFDDLNEDEARALASRYLHFHFPELFPIYDSHIASALALLIPGDCGFLALADFDAAYGRFHACCRKLTERIAPLVGRRLSPRELDRVLRAWVDHAGEGFAYPQERVVNPSVTNPSMVNSRPQPVYA